VAEPVAIDAPRSDMFLRRFRMQAVIGLTGELVDALMALGRDMTSLLGHSIVVALPDAAPTLRGAGLDPVDAAAARARCGPSSRRKVVAPTTTAANGASNRSTASWS
jgi:hypothetical protein